MAIYTYINEDISTEAICQAFAHGAQGSIFNIKPEVDENGVLTGLYTVVVDTTAPKTLIDGLIASSENGDLFYEKTIKIQSITQKSEDLEVSGTEVWVPGMYVPTDKSSAEGYFTDLEFYQANPSKLSATTPYMVKSLDGRGAVTSTLTDIQTLAVDCADRLIYIYTAVSNGDGSKGEIQYIQEVLACTNLLQVQSIIDTRV